MKRAWSTEHKRTLINYPCEFHGFVAVKKTCCFCYLKYNTLTKLYTSETSMLGVKCFKGSNTKGHE